jgi:hypothetical protein
MKLGGHHTSSIPLITGLFIPQASLEAATFYAAGLLDCLLRRRHMLPPFL